MLTFLDALEVENMEDGKIEGNTQSHSKRKTHMLIIIMSVVSIILLLAVLMQLSIINSQLKDIALSIGSKDVSGNSAITITGNAVKNTVEKNDANQDAESTNLMDDDSIMGSMDAKVTIIEFSDYECPFCVKFYDDTMEQIKENYVKTGKVRFVYRDFPLGMHQYAQKSAEAAECAGEQGKYFEMYDKLFSEGVKGGVSSYKKYAKELSLDQVKFDSCLDSGQMAAEIKKDLLDGQKAGVTGTPAFFVNAKMIKGAQPYSVFKTEIDAALQN